MNCRTKTFRGGLEVCDLLGPERQLIMVKKADSGSLTDELPPRLPDAPAPESPAARPLLVECAECGRPGPADALPDGLCRPCRCTVQARAGAADAPAAELPGGRDVKALVGSMRNLMRAP
ncbi:hypothetical protein AB0H45_01505 [Streptomyces atroolivaceus]|uniref:Uncharacterized protein n=1 Tax=Streptomyces atroolivaceus TaxID=66869 RepID=A0ABV9V0X0_STRAZ|nr:hypothetical protein [Streptomyces atroolivaceus]